jgi:5-methylcytosine-specific restriction enzyme A
MPTRPPTRCPACHRLHAGKGKCGTCRAETQRASDQARGSSAARGYTGQHVDRFRPRVLARDPHCVCTEDGHGHTGRCGAPSTHADHHPLSRRQLVARHLDPDDPAHGRGLCAPCHNSHTADAQPGGWNRRHA